MATSSITKEFYVKDWEAFECLKKELDSTHVRMTTTESPSLEEGRKLLDTFTFRSKT